MLEPEYPVVLFAEDGHMWWIGDPVLAGEQLESVEDVTYGYDGLARPLRVVGNPGDFRLEVASDESQEADLRQQVHAYYRNFARIRSLKPPEELDVRAFLRAVAEDRVEE